MKHIEKPGLFAMLCLSAFLLAGTKASAETLSSGEAEWARGVGEITALSQGDFLDSEIHPCPAAGDPVPVRTDEQEDPVMQLDCGIWGVLCSEDMPFRAASTKGIHPINTGFIALGWAGATGKIDGPGWKGNGTYRMEKNNASEMSITIVTGYIEGRMTLTRDPQTGADTLHFVGRNWDKDKDRWGPHFDEAGELIATYDAGEDEGKITWKENGVWKSERYWNGRRGRTKMTIEFGGGWNHTFIQK